MPNWHVEVLPDRLYLHHMAEDAEGPVWRGEVELVSGAPGLDSHPDLDFGFRAIAHPGFRENIRPAWSYSIPDEIGGVRQTGLDRRMMLLEAQGAWKLLLRFPPNTPPFVYRAVAQGFNATPQAKQAKRRAA